MHFDAAGRPDGWVDRSLANWFALPAVDTGLALLLTVLVLGVDAAAARRPELCNLPSKRAFVALSPAGRRHALQPMRSFLLAALVLLGGLFCWIVEGAAAVAVGARAALAPWPVFAFVGALLALLVPTVCTIRARIVAAAAAEGVAAAPGPVP